MNFNLIITTCSDFSLFARLRLLTYHFQWLQSNFTSCFSYASSYFHFDWTLLIVLAVFWPGSTRHLTGSGELVLTAFFQGPLQWVLGIDCQQIEAEGRGRRALRSLVAWIIEDVGGLFSDLSKEGWGIISRCACRPASHFLCHSLICLTQIQTAHRYLWFLFAQHHKPRLSLKSIRHWQISFASMMREHGFSDTVRFGTR